MTDETTELRKRLAEPGPKRLLALDGGGIRGLITLGFLARIEEILRERYNNADLVLSDYYDLIGGTSTGSIIAGALALGWPVHRIRQLYLTLGTEAFQPRPTFFGPITRKLGAKFDDKPVAKLVKERLGDITLGSERLRVGVCIIAKRVDTASVWVLVNLPDNPFYEYNKDMKLWQVIRASTAAPTYFEPQWIDDLGGGERGMFVDGGVSMHLNPALQLLMVANLDGFSLRWPLGASNIMVTSVGTGSFAPTRSIEELKKKSPLAMLGGLANMLRQMMRDSSELNQTILQWMSETPTPHHIDLQIGDLSGDQLGPQPLITYQRYDIDLDRDALSAVGMDVSEAQAMALREMADTDNVTRLDEAGQKAAETFVREEHFPSSFDRAMPADAG